MSEKKFRVISDKIQIGSANKEFGWDNNNSRIIFGTQGDRLPHIRYVSGTGEIVLPTLVYDTDHYSATSAILKYNGIAYRIAGEFTGDIYAKLDTGVWTVQDVRYYSEGTDVSGIIDGSENLDAVLAQATFSFEGGAETTWYFTFYVKNSDAAALLDDPEDAIVAFLDDPGFVISSSSGDFRIQNVWVNGGIGGNFTLDETAIEDAEAELWGEDGAGGLRSDFGNYYFYTSALTAGELEGEEIVTYNFTASIAGGEDNNYSNLLDGEFIDINLSSEPYEIKASASLFDIDNLMIVAVNVAGALRATLVLSEEQYLTVRPSMPEGTTAIGIPGFFKKTVGERESFVIDLDAIANAFDQDGNPISQDIKDTIALWGGDGANGERVVEDDFIDLKVGKILGDGSELENVKLPFTEITDSSVQMESNNGYIMANPSEIDATLPESPEVGDVIRIIGKGERGTGGWNVLQNADDSIQYGDKTSIQGENGVLESTYYTDCVELLCVTVEEGNIVWAVVWAIGILSVSVGTEEAPEYRKQSSLNLAIYDYIEAVMDGDAGTATIDWNLAQNAEITVDDDYEVIFTAPIHGNTKLTLKLINGGAGTLTWPGTMLWQGKEEPEWTLSGTDIIAIYYDGSNYYAAAGLDFGVPA